MSLFGTSMRIVFVNAAVLPLEPLVDELSESQAIVESKCDSIEAVQFAERMRPKFDRRLSRVKIDPCPELARCAELLPAAAAKGLVSKDAASRFLIAAHSAVEQKIKADKAPPVSAQSLVGYAALGGTVASLLIALVHMNFTWSAASIIAGAGIVFANYRADRALQREYADYAAKMRVMELVRQVIELTTEQLADKK